MTARDEDISIPLSSLSLQAKHHVQISDEDLLKRCPDRVRSLYALAKANNIEGALGRAIYVHSRMLNMGSVSLRRDSLGDSDYDLLLSVRWHTAHRWRQHIADGGSFYALKYTVEQHRDMQRARRDKKLSDGARLRLGVKRARRAMKRGEPCPTSDTSND